MLLNVTLLYIFKCNITRGDNKLFSGIHSYFCCKNENGEIKHADFVRDPEWFSVASTVVCRSERRWRAKTPANQQDGREIL